MGNFKDNLLCYHDITSSCSVAIGYLGTKKILIDHKATNTNDHVLLLDIKIADKNTNTEKRRTGNLK